MGIREFWELKKPNKLPRWDSPGLALKDAPPPPKGGQFNTGNDLIEELLDTPAAENTEPHVNLSQAFSVAPESVLSSPPNNHDSKSIQCLKVLD